MKENINVIIKEIYDKTLYKYIMNNLLQKIKNNNIHKIVFCTHFVYIIKNVLFMKINNM